MAKRSYTPPRTNAASNALMVKVVNKTHIVIDTTKALDALGSWAVGRIKFRTQQGKDMNERPFAQYSKKHEKALRRGGQQATPIDLRISGGMIGNLTPKGRGKRMGYHYVTIGFNNKKIRKYTLKNNQMNFTGEGKITFGELAAIHHRGIGKMPRRAFFGLSKADKQRASQHALKVGIIRQGTGAPRRLS